MKVLVVLVALVALIPASVVAESSGSTVSMDIASGPFSTALSFEGEYVVLTVDDATGSGRGWWVTVSCACLLEKVGEIATIAGDSQHEPRWLGATLVADEHEGSGAYRQMFKAVGGDWVVTSGQGALLG